MPIDNTTTTINHLYAIDSLGEFLVDRLPPLGAKSLEFLSSDTSTCGQESGMDWEAKSATLEFIEY